MSALGTDLANKVNRCSLDRGTLTVVAESSAWAARIRFALAEAQPAIASAVPDFKELVVRVRPRGTRSPKP
jgi:predicted nucleic acid-binding Zn ribbon protein